MPIEYPDIHELHDWPMYGPKDPRIADLVRALVLDHGLRVEEIEAIIEAALLASASAVAVQARRGVIQVSQDFTDAFGPLAEWPDGQFRSRI